MTCNQSATLCIGHVSMYEPVKFALVLLQEVYGPKDDFTPAPVPLKVCLQGRTLQCPNVDTLHTQSICTLAFAPEKSHFKPTVIATWTSLHMRMLMQDSSIPTALDMHLSVQANSYTLMTCHHQCPCTLACAGLLQHIHHASFKLGQVSKPAWY